MTNPLVSVVIPVFNSEKIISQTLKAVLNQDYSPIEIIVVDDGSTDGSAEVIKSFPPVKYVHQQNAGPASARNRGAAQARGSIIFFTDSDCLPHPDWVSKSVAGFTDNSIAAVCGSYGIANPQSILARCIHQEILFRHKNLPDFPKVFGSYNVAIRHDVFNKVGGFNQIYRRASGEDNDLSYKITRAGYKIFFARESLVDHYHTASLQKYLKEQYRHGFWRVQMYADHLSMSKGDDYTYWKDIVEPMLCLVCVFSLILTIFSMKWLVASVIVAFILMTIELVSAVLINHQRNDIIYSFWMMLCRAFSRTLGLSTGIIAFFIKILPKKFK